MKHLSHLLLALLLLLSACHQAGTDGTRQPADSLVFTDDYQRTVTIAAQPQRIVSASPAITEIIFALGAQDRLVGRTDYCLYPAQTQQIESIGGIANLNIEKVIALQPDLVVASSLIPQKSIDHIAAMGIPMVCLTEQPRFEALYATISRIGQLLGLDQRADSLNASLQQRLQQLQSTLPHTDSLSRPSVYYVVGYGKAGNFTAGGNTFIDHIITLAGGRNIAHHIEGWSFSLEALLQADPDFIIIRSSDADAFCRTAPYNQLRAVRQHHVIPIDSGTIDLQVPRNIDAIEYIAAKISQS